MTDGTKVSAADYGTAMLYDQIGDKVAKLRDERAVPTMAARLYAKRVGFDQFIREIMEDGVPYVAAKCRAEMMVRHEFFVRMIKDHPPEDPNDVKLAAEELANDLAVFDSPDAAIWLLRYLDRLQRCELRLISANSAAN